MENCKPISTPLPINFKLSSNMCPTNEHEKMEMSRVPYASAVGSLSRDFTESSAILRLLGGVEYCRLLRTMGEGEFMYFDSTASTWGQKSSFLLNDATSAQLSKTSPGDSLSDGALNA